MTDQSFTVMVYYAPLRWLLLPDALLEVPVRRLVSKSWRGREFQVDSAVLLRSGLAEIKQHKGHQLRQVFRRVLRQAISQHLDNARVGAISEDRIDWGEVATNE